MLTLTPCDCNVQILRRKLLNLPYILR